MRLTPFPILIGAVSTLACSGDIVGPGDEVVVALCDDIGELPAPSIVGPGERSLFQPGEDITFEAQADSAAELLSEELVGAESIEYEVWQMAGDEPIVKVWSGSIDDPEAGTALTLGEGFFELGYEELSAWSDFAIRARRSYDDLCDAGPFSDFRRFRIDDGSQVLFNEDVIRDVYIELSRESWDAIHAEARPPACVPYSRNYYPGTVTFDGVTYENAGVRVKGGCGSSRDLNGKSSFKINLSDYSGGGECPAPRRHLGLKRLTLNNEVQDPSFSHERLAYAFYDLVGVPVPRRANARVHVKGPDNEDFQLWGLYLHLESIDRRFLQRRFNGLGAEGALYEGTYFCDIVPGNKPGDDEGPATCFGKKFSDTCSSPEPGGDPYNYAPLRTFIDQIDALPAETFYPAITEIVDFDSFLSQWAAESIMNHWDGGIFDVMNNYRIYHDPVSGKWVMIPTGMDQSWNGGQRPIHPWNPNNVIARRCLQNQACEDAFAARLKEVLAIFEAANFAGKAEAIRTQLAAEVAADPRKESNNFDGAINNTINFIQNRPAQIRTWLTEQGYGE